MSQQLALHSAAAFAHAGVHVQKSLQEFREGMILKGTVNAMYFNHGIKVDIGGTYDGCAPLVIVRCGCYAVRIAAVRTLKHLGNIMSCAG